MVTWKSEGRLMLDPAYKKLPACRAIMQLIRAIYALTKHFPADEKSGLTAMLKRTATSLAPKFAESHCQTDPAESCNALAAAQATLRDLCAYMDVAENLRMTSRRRFRRPRRLAQKVARNLVVMLDANEPSTDRVPPLSLATGLSSY